MLDTNVLVSGLLNPPRRAQALVTGNAPDFEPREGSHRVTVASPDAFLEIVEGRQP